MTFVTRQHKLEALALEAQWQTLVLPSKPFALAAAIASRQNPSLPLIVYNEGDGQAFTATGEVSSDPTPENPLALRLALIDSSSNMAYLARPCQYVLASQLSVCNPAYWSTHQYAPSVISSMSNALDLLETLTGTHQLILVGYSGGGAVATLLAERRGDVVGLVTVAANLDLTTWSRMTGHPVLDASLDPTEQAHRLGHMHQVHFTGADDIVVPSAVTDSFVGRLPIDADATIVRMPGFDHACCWVENWQRIKNDFLRHQFNC